MKTVEDFVWSHSAAVAAMHPIGGREVGWDAVRASFEQVAQLASDGKIELKDQLIHVVGDVAYEVNVEHGKLKLAGQQVAIEHRVTNIYQREAGAWKMILHHTDTSPEEPFHELGPTIAERILKILLRSSPVAIDGDLKAPDA